MVNEIRQCINISDIPLLCHWGRMMHMCHMIYVSVNVVIIGSNNDFSPVSHQTVIWNNASSLLIEPW